MGINPHPGSWIEEWLSPDRFSTFLVVAKGSRQLALELYEWNARLSSSFLHDLAHLEVGLRNAYDKALSPAVLAHEKHWTDPDTKLNLFPKVSKFDGTRGITLDTNDYPKKKINDALFEAGKTTGGNPSPGKVIAEIDFGFWAHLTSSAQDKYIWVPYLNKVYAPKTDRKRLHNSLQEIRKLRNRVAHHEPLFADAELNRRKIVAIGVRVLPTDVIRHVAANSQILDILSNRPK